jgi:hypothetical protein
VNKLFGHAMAYLRGGGGLEFNKMIKKKLSIPLLKEQRNICDKITTEALQT